MLRRSPQIEHEREVAITDLLKDNRFAPASGRAGPFHLTLAIAENRLAMRADTPADIDKLKAFLASEVARQRRLAAQGGRQRHAYEAAVGRDDRVHGQVDAARREQVVGRHKDDLAAGLNDRDRRDEELLVGHADGRGRSDPEEVAPPLHRTGGIALP